VCRFWVAGDGSVSSWLRAARWDSWLWVCWVCGFAGLLGCGFAGDGSVSSWLRAARRGGTRGCGFVGFVGFRVCWVAGLLGLRVMGQ
jgi:hypothetical protein